MVPRETVSFAFPAESPDVSQDEVEGNIRTRGKTKLTTFPKGPYIKCFVIYLDLPSTITAKQSINKQSTERATTAELYTG